MRRQSLVAPVAAIVVALAAQARADGGAREARSSEQSEATPAADESAEGDSSPDLVLREDPSDEGNSEAPPDTSCESNPDDAKEQQGYEPDQHGCHPEEEAADDADESERDGAEVDDSMPLDAPTWSDDSDGDGVVDLDDMFTSPMSSTEQSAGVAPLTWQWWAAARLGLTTLDASALGSGSPTAGGSSTVPSMGLALGLSKAQHLFAVEYVRGFDERFDLNAASLAYAHCWGETWRPSVGLSLGYAWAGDLPVGGDQTALVRGATLGADLGLGYLLTDKLELGVRGSADLWLAGRRAVDCETCSVEQSKAQSGVGGLLHYGLDLKYTF